MPRPFHCSDSGFVDGTKRGFVIQGSIAMQGESFFRSYERVISQVSVIPYRRDEKGLEFCLITSRRSGKWGFPKGGVGSHGSLIAAALAESYEESGLFGRVTDSPLGQYPYRKQGKRFLVTMLLMETARIDDRWPESNMRHRIWANLDQARALIDRMHLRKFLELAAWHLLPSANSTAAQLFPQIEIATTSSPLFNSDTEQG
jgi:8-oxo-dGTP pyrophosphatase MutT (NUDIX family)